AWEDSGHAGSDGTLADDNGPFARDKGGEADFDASDIGDGIEFSGRSVERYAEISSPEFCLRVHFYGSERGHKQSHNAHETKNDGSQTSRYGIFLSIEGLSIFKGSLDRAPYKPILSSRHPMRTIFLVIVSLSFAASGATAQPQPDIGKPVDTDHSAKMAMALE